MAVSTIDALYNGTSEKLTTSATGITVTGTVAATAYTGDGSALTGTGSPSIDDNGNATAITIDSSENVGIGTTSPTHRLDVLNDGGEQLRILAWDQSTSARANIDFWYLDAGGSPYQNSQISTLAAGNAGNGNLIFSTRPTSGTLTERMRILSSGGITFNGDTAAANALNDYEEGTFTAGVETGTVGGGDGVYVKVGDMVYVGFTIGNFSNTSSGNAIVFNGLPFASNSNNHGCNGSVFCRYISGGFPDASQINTSATTGRMWKSGSTAWASVNHNDITSGTNCYFYVCLTYRAA